MKGSSYNKKDGYELYPNFTAMETRMTAAESMVEELQMEKDGKCRTLLL